MFILYIYSFLLYSKIAEWFVSITAPNCLTPYKDETPPEPQNELDAIREEYVNDNITELELEQRLDDALSEEDINPTPTMTNDNKESERLQ